MAQITDKQIREIAAATKIVCSADGYGHQVVVWPNGTWEHAVSSNDIVSRFTDYGRRREWPIARFDTPATKNQVREQIELGAANIRIAAEQVESLRDLWKDA